MSDVATTRDLTAGRTPETLLALDLYKLARKIFDDLAKGCDDPQAAIDRLRRRWQATTKVTGPLCNAFDKGGKLESLAGRPEARLLALLDTPFGASDLLLRPSIRSAQPVTEVQPDAPTPEPDRDGDVIVPLGASWVPDVHYHHFAMKIVGARSLRDVTVTKIPHGGGYIVKVETVRTQQCVTNTKTYGTEFMSGAEILECALNLKLPFVYKKVIRDGKTERVQAPEHTADARVKLEEIRTEWHNWLRADQPRWRSVREAYWKIFSSVRRRAVSKVAIAEVDFPALSVTADGRRFDPRPHQREAVARLSTKPTDENQDDSSLIVHHVGYGKTFSGLAGCVRSWQTGQIDRAIVVVPKTVLNQWRRAAVEHYPTLADRIACAPGEAGPTEKLDFFWRVANGEANIVICTYEQFSWLDMEPKNVIAHWAAELAPLKRTLETLEAQGRKKDAVFKRVKRLLKHGEGLAEDAIKRATDAQEERQMAAFQGRQAPPTWEAVLGGPGAGARSMVVYDEWQYLKRILIHTRMMRIAGLPTGSSVRAEDALLKTHYVLNSGGRAAGLTGTPITNSLAEAYVTMKFFQPKLLHRLGMTAFDDWAGAFTEPMDSVEMDATGRFRPVTRLKFVNVPELLESLGQTWAFASRVEEVKRPDLVGGEPQIVEVEGSQELADYVVELAGRAEAIRAGEVDPADDNMLKVTSDGRLAAMWNGRPEGAFPKPYMKSVTHCELVLEERWHVLSQATDRCVGCGVALVDINGRFGEHFRYDIRAGRRTKLDACAEKVWEVYEAHHEDRGVQLVFSDLGTPKGNPDEDDTPEERARLEGLYGLLRDRLVDKGILASQIAFVHSAKTEQERVDLFRAVNAGAVRVLVGSTDKLGVGVNAQRRVVAVHHLDCPWRPDRIIQRTGRGRRDGNLWDSLYEFVYVVSRSYDVCLWQLIQAKAEFISKLQEGIAATRQAEDVGDLVLTAAMAKALALGDERVIDKIKLETQLAHLERQSKSWRIQQETAHQELVRLPMQVEKLRVDLKAIEAAQSLKVRPAEFTVQLRGPSSPDFEEIKDRVKADSRIYLLANNFRPILAKPLRVGEYRGCPLYVVQHWGTTSAVLVIGAGSSEVPGLKDKACIEIMNIHSADTFRDLDRELGMIEMRVSSIRKTIEREDQRIADLKAEVGRPWPHTDAAVKALVEYEYLCDALAQNGLVDRRKFRIVPEEVVDQYLKTELQNLRAAYEREKEDHTTNLESYKTLLLAKEKEIVNLSDRLQESQLDRLRVNQDRMAMTMGLAFVALGQVCVHVERVAQAAPKKASRFGLLEVDDAGNVSSLSAGKDDGSVATK